MEYLPLLNEKLLKELLLEIFNDVEEDKFEDLKITVEEIVRKLNVYS